MHISSSLLTGSVVCCISCCRSHASACLCQVVDSSPWGRSAAGTPSVSQGHCLVCASAYMAPSVACIQSSGVSRGPVTSRHSESRTYQVWLAAWYLMHLTWPVSPSCMVHATTYACVPAGDDVVRRSLVHDLHCTGRRASVGVMCLYMYLHIAMDPKGPIGLLPCIVRARLGCPGQCWGPRRSSAITHEWMVGPSSMRLPSAMFMACTQHMWPTCGS